MGGSTNYPAFKDVIWWFSPCSKQGYKCNFARRRKKYTSMCGKMLIGSTENTNVAQNDGTYESYLGGTINPDKSIVARFTVDLNGSAENAVNGSKRRFFWGDDNEFGP